MRNGQRLVVCRCEDVVLEEIRDAIALGGRTFDDVKRVTRAGMGICQGRTCESAITGLLVASGVVAPADAVPRSVRPPIRAVTLDALASCEPDAPPLPDET